MNATVTLTGIQITATNLGLPESPDWYAWYNERDTQSTGSALTIAESLENQSEFGAILQYADANTETSNADGVFEIEALDAAGSAITTAETLSDTASIGTISQFGTANFTLSGVNGEIITANLASFGFANTQIEGLESEIIAGEVTTSVITPVSATVELVGIGLNFALGTVRATEQSAEIMRLSGNPRRYSVQIENANLNLRGIQAKIEPSGLKAFGTTVISAAVRLTAQNMSVNDGAVTADGVLDISEEELVLFLMAA